MLRGMSRLIITLLYVALLAMTGPVGARTLQARIDRVTTPLATMENVTVRLHWSPGAATGDLRLSVGHLSASDLGYDFQNMVWTCPLSHDASVWRCAGAVRSASGGPLQLSLAFADTGIQARLAGKSASIDLRHATASPDLTTIDLTRVPAIWAQALLAQVWEAPTLAAGTLDSHLQIHAPGDDTTQPLRVAGELHLSGIGFDTSDGSIAGLGLNGDFNLDYRKFDSSKFDSSRFDSRTLVTLEGALRGGEVLVGKAYLALPATPVAVAVNAIGSDSEGWRLPAFSWRDPGALAVTGSAGFAADAALSDLELHLQSSNIAPLGGRYLSGWLGPAGLDGLVLGGGLEADLRMTDGVLQTANAALHDIDMSDPDGRFRFNSIDGQLLFTAGEQLRKSQVSWASGALYGLPFGAAQLPLESRSSVLRLREPTTMTMLGGQVRLDHLALRPPGATKPSAFAFGLTIEQLDIGNLAQTLGWPAFKGSLSGRIPNAYYIDDRLNFDGGLTVQLFDGTVQVSHLVLERPFGTAPSLSADIAIDDLNLKSLTGVFGFGSISGRLDGHVNDLRLVDWHPTRFDAAFHTDPTAGVPQRISQRAVQSISSVGDASFANSLQGRLIALVDTFGYRQIGISCKLVRQVCEMGGLRSGENTFTIVSGAGLPRLTVIGHNRLVDWPTFAARVAAIGKGEIKPVVE